MKWRPARTSAMPDPIRSLAGVPAETALRRLTRRSFAVGALAALAGLGGWRWLKTAALEDGAPWPLRRVLRFNEGLASALFSPARRAPTFPAERVQGPARTNGLVGLSGEVPGSWQLRVQHAGRSDRLIDLGALEGLERVSLVTELK